MVTEAKTTTEGKGNGHHKIQTVPLTQILDDIDSSIRLANEAAKDARKAAEEARKAGEIAANEAARVASEAIARVDEVARKALELAELLKTAGMDTAAYYEKKLSGKSAEKRSA